MNNTETPLHATDVNYPEPSRWELLRDVAVFQFKLLVDGFRDLLLVPFSLIAALIDLVGRGQRSGQHFYDVVLLGRRSEKWINLFGAADRIINHAPHRDHDEEPGLDDFVGKVESLVVDQYENGKVTASAKKAIDKLLDTVQSTSKNSKG